MNKEERRKELLKKFHDSATELFEELKNDEENISSIAYVRTVVCDFDKLLNSLTDYRKTSKLWKGWAEQGKRLEVQANESNE